VSKHDLDVIYKQNLESSIIEYVAKEMNITVREAMDYYYSSKLSEQIQSGENGIENLDYKYLANDLMENEKLITKQ
jgi:5-bromo-4-chloroindolyl phosphate hydrolysis protein